MQKSPVHKYQSFDVASNIRFILLLLLSLAGYVAIGYFTQRTEFIQLISLYTLLFILFGWIYLKADTGPQLRVALVAAVSFRAALIFCLPALSDDFYRFQWDGWLMTLNANPYLYLPQEVINQYEPFVSERQLAIFQKLNSQQYYSVYPPVMQYIFFGAVKLFPDSLLGAVAAMKTLIVLMEAASIYLMLKIAWYFKVRRKAVLLYAFNPLVIIELTGNLHFEAVMIFFVVLSTFLLVRRYLWLSAVGLGLAIGTKFVPVLFLPFLIRRLGWRFIPYLIALAVSVVIIFIPFKEPWILYNMFESVKLYYQHFEFNASLYYVLRWIGYQIYGYNTIEILGMILAALTALIVLLMALFEKKRDFISLMGKFLWAYAIYLLLATTVHPWYITPLIAFGLFTRYCYPWVWAFLIPFTYITYSITTYTENHWVVLVEYLVLYAFMGFELLRASRLWKPIQLKWVFIRARLKVDRLLPNLQKRESILDIGTGNGGVSALLMKEGFEVTPADVIDQSLVPEVKPFIIEGKHLPFADKQFDRVLLLTVLHHTEEQEAMLLEVKRVGKRVIVMEDIYSNPVQKYLTYGMDSLINMEFAGHPHTNRTDKEWQKIFNELGYTIEKVTYHPVLLIFRQATYYLKS